MPNWDAMLNMGNPCEEEARYEQWVYDKVSEIMDDVTCFDHNEMKEKIVDFIINMDKLSDTSKEE